MAIEGKLEDVSLADICQLLAMGRKTGCLTVTDRSNFGYVYFDGGRVVYANVLNRPDRLGELLVRNEIISREDLSQAMEQQARDSGKRLGRILVERGTLSEDDLLRFITVQIEEAVYHLFAWERGAFHFDPDQRPDEEGISTVSINAESLLLEGARRVDEWSMIEKKIPSLDVIFGLERDPRGEEGVELTADQEKVLTLIDGARTVSDMVSESGLVEFEVAKALYGLIQAGFLQRTGQRETTAVGDRGREAAQRLALASAYDRAGMVEDAVREYRGVIDLDPAEPTARVRLAVLALREGDAEGALEHYEAAPPRVRDAYPALRNRALALEFLERYDDALVLLHRAEAERPADPGVQLARAVLLFKAGKPRQSIDAFERYRDALPEDAVPSPLYYAFGLLASAGEGRWEDALRLGRKGLGHYPDDGAILVNLGAVLERRGEGGAAEALYLRAVSQTPAPPQAHRNLGDLAYRRGDQAGARAHLERAVRIDPELGDDTYLKLGNLAYREGDRDQAGQYWRRALELNPENEVVRTNLELVAASSGR